MKRLERELRTNLSKTVKIITNGGRVFGVTALGDTLESAIKHAYGATEKISWKNKYFRTDIGKKGLTYL